jgi:hypothetical protein
MANAVFMIVLLHSIELMIFISWKMNRAIRAERVGQ